MKIKNDNLIVMPRTNLQLNTPIMIIDSEIQGPVIWLTAKIHGDEVGGSMVVYDLFNELLKKDPRYVLLKGRIYAFPVLNPSGARSSTRNLPYSDENLNRCFPGKENGTLGERIANWFFKEITKTNPDLVLDLHNDWFGSIPYALIDPNLDMINDDTFNLAKQYAISSGLIVTQEKEIVEGCLSLNMLKANIPSMTIEVGGYSVIDEPNIKCGVEAIFNILKNIGMVQDNFPGIQRMYKIPDQVKGQILFYSDKPYSSHRGVSRPVVSAGTFVKKGKIVAQIVNRFGTTLENIIVPEDGIVLGPSGNPQVYPGSPVMSFGLVK